MTRAKILKTTGQLREVSKYNKQITLCMNRKMSNATSSKSVHNDKFESRTTQKCLTIDTIDPNIVKLQYAVRGAIDQRAQEIERELKAGVKKPFKQIIRANLGDAQAMGQKPITFIRQVLACITMPSLMNNDYYPEDVEYRAKELLCHVQGNSIGSYTDILGITMIRKHIAEYIEKRDGYPCNPSNVSLSSGAALAIRNVIQLFMNKIDGKATGIMVPIPQYPLYSATLQGYGLEKVDYYLDEDNDWALNINELERAYQLASKNCNVRAIVVINPGNPTGQVLTRKNIEDIIAFAAKYQLLIFADEVYQDNVYAEDLKFYSIKKVLTEGPYKKTVELASFNSISKGFVGECGLRGAWMEVVNLDPQVQDKLYNVMKVKLCPNIYGQAAVDLVARPPQKGDPSYELYITEKTQVLESLKKRAFMIKEAFNKMPGFKCNNVQGAMYAFPQLELPSKAIEAAKKEGKAPDLFYALRLLEETGIAVVPGSGFGQNPGTFHFRTTILPQPEVLKNMLEVFEKFHEKFSIEYS